MTTDTKARIDAVPSSPANPITRHVPTASRIALGPIFFGFGLGGFFFSPPPADALPPGAAALGAALMKSGYLFQLIKGTEVLAGALLLSNRFVPLALALLAPVIVNIVAFHAFLAPAGLAIPVVVLALEIQLAWTYRKLYRPMLAARAAKDL